MEGTMTKSGEKVGGSRSSETNNFISSTTQQRQTEEGVCEEYDKGREVIMETLPIAFTSSPSDCPSEEYSTMFLHNKSEAFLMSISMSAEPWTIQCEIQLRVIASGSINFAEIFLVTILLMIRTQTLERT
jgi:hypothetical protein